MRHCHREPHAACVHHPLRHPAHGRHDCHAKRLQVCGGVLTVRPQWLPPCSGGPALLAFCNCHTFSLRALFCGTQAHTLGPAPTHQSALRTLTPSGYEIKHVQWLECPLRAPPPALPQYERHLCGRQGGWEGQRSDLGGRLQDLPHAPRRPGKRKCVAWGPRVLRIPWFQG